jgi:integration host factor subunit beta
MRCLPRSRVIPIFPGGSSDLSKAFFSSSEGGLVGMTTTTTTTKKDLIDRIADQTRQKRTVVKKTVQCFLDNVIHELRSGHRLEFRDFGVFEIRERAARMAQNPKTLERVPVPPRKTVKFKVGRLMKDALEGRMPNGALVFSYDDMDDDETEGHNGSAAG